MDPLSLSKDAPPGAFLPDGPTGTEGEEVRWASPRLSLRSAPSHDGMLPEPIALVLEPESRHASNVSRHQKIVLVGENCRLNLQASSCFFLDPDNRFRRFIFAVVDHRYFERAVLAIIVLNCITLILATPWIEDQPGVYIIVDVGEYLFQILFTIEMVLKIIALGFVLHPHSYLRSNWNRIDFVIVILGFVSFFFSSNLSAVRMVRILRPLKTVSKVPALTNIVATLAASVPRLRDVLLLLSFVIMIFAVLALQLFVGVMQQRCYFYPNVSVNGSYRADAALYPYDPNPCSFKPRQRQPVPSRHAL